MDTIIFGCAASIVIFSTIFIIVNIKWSSRGKTLYTIETPLSLRLEEFQKSLLIILLCITLFDAAFYYFFHMGVILITYISLFILFLVCIPEVVLVLTKHTVIKEEGIQLSIYLFKWHYLKITSVKDHMLRFETINLLPTIGRRPRSIHYFVYSKNEEILSFVRKKIESLTEDQRRAELNKELSDWKGWAMAILVLIILAGVLLPILLISFWFIFTFHL